MKRQSWLIPKPNTNNLSIKLLWYPLCTRTLVLKGLTMVAQVVLDSLYEPSEQVDKCSLYEPSEQVDKVSKEVLKDLQMPQAVKQL
jgi:hypothetical protein